MAGPVGRPTALGALLVIAPILSLGAQEPPDTAAADTAAADTMPQDTARTLPGVPGAAPAGIETGIWEWDREDLLATRALTLGELLDQIPGVISLRGGDFGTPRVMTAFGAGGGGVRVFVDGVEHVPLEGSVPDLARIGLGSVERVRVDRRPSGLRVEVRTLRPTDARPYSLIEAGTGDLNTNLLRGTFLHPDALGGNAAVALDRIDTGGPGLAEPGSVTAGWLRHTFVSGDRFGLAMSFSSSTQDRGVLFQPADVSRTDWTVRGRARVTDGVVADAFWSSASLDGEASGTGGGFPFVTESRSQVGGRLSVARDPFYGRLAYRNFGGRGLPNGSLEAEGGIRRPGLGGIEAGFTRDQWDPRDVFSVRLRAWSDPFHGFSLFGSGEDYERGVPFLPPLPAGETGTQGTSAPSGPEPAFTSGWSARLGFRFHRGGLLLSGARLLLETDRLHPLGLPMDRDGPTLPGGEREGWEWAFRVPLLLLDGLALEGSGQLWEERTEPWPYFPRAAWTAGASYHDTFLESENLELWGDIGVSRRSAMSVAAVDPDAVASAPPLTVPFFQGWYARVQIRVVSVRVFIRWENFTRRQLNQDFPGRVLPAIRAVYGVRWTLWN